MAVALPLARGKTASESLFGDGGTNRFLSGRGQLKERLSLQRRTYLLRVSAVARKLSTQAWREPIRGP